MIRKTEPPADDKHLAQDLEKLQSDWNRVEPAEPPALLDQAVLNAARRDIESRSRKRPLKWLGGFATATVAVLAITVVWLPDQPVNLPEKMEKGAVQERIDPAGSPVREKQERIELKAAPAAPSAPEPARTRQEARRAGESAAFSSAADALAEEESLLPAEDWIEEMLALKAAGEWDELEMALGDFLETYPDYPLPEALEELQR